MDGFAVRLRPSENGDVLRFRPRKVVGRSAPGDNGRRLPRMGYTTATEVLTGAPLPPGTSAVIRSEHVRKSGNRISARVAVTSGHDVARRGEDFRPGSPIVPAGARIRPWHVAALVANGVSRVRVLRQPRVGVLATGSEIVPATSGSRRRGVRDTTGPLLLGLLDELGIATVDLGRVPDHLDAIRKGVSTGLVRCDLLITIGGSSGGNRDEVPRALGGIRGVRWVARRLRLRPGSTASVATVRNRPVFVLPGPPVAAFAVFTELVDPFLRDRGIVTTPARTVVSAKLDHGILHGRGVRELVRVGFRMRNGVNHVSSLERHGSARLSSLTKAEGLLVLDERRGAYRAGETVEVVLLDARTGGPRRRVR
jgi:molybdopterin molybdotransferase